MSLSTLLTVRKLQEALHAKAKGPPELFGRTGGLPTAAWMTASFVGSVGGYTMHKVRGAGASRFPVIPCLLSWGDFPWANA